jgi:putative solute:sodium symporter small subunit
MTTNDAAPLKPAPDVGPNLHQPEIHASLERYWVRNVRVMATLTVVWLIIGLGCGVLFADRLNEYTLFGTGYPLGFWFAQQGSIIGFVLIILVYCTLMNRLDVKHHAELEQLRNGQRGDR